MDCKVWCVTMVGKLWWRNNGLEFLEKTMDAKFSSHARRLTLNPRCISIAEFPPVTKFFNSLLHFSVEKVYGHHIISTHSTSYAINSEFLETAYVLDKPRIKKACYYNHWWKQRTLRAVVPAKPWKVYPVCYTGT